MQIAYAFDRKSLRKTGIGLLIAIMGSLTVFLGVFGIELNDYILNSDPINWFLVVSLTVAPLSTAVINAAKEFVAGIERELAAEYEDKEITPEVKEIVQELKDQVVSEAGAEAKAEEKK